MLGPPTARLDADGPEVADLQPYFPDLRIDSMLGQGGMGSVYKVWQTALERFAALKVLPLDFASRPGFRDRFTREARTLAALNHPHIVTVYDFGERHHHFFFLMEYVDGGDLRSLIRSRSPSTRETLHVIDQVCDALAYAHEQGVVHRDIKPGNVLLDSRGRVKIADFGVAKLLGQTDTGMPAGYVLGTPRYMAPEQLESPVTVDHRADIYSLGVLLYELLTGNLPTEPVTPLPRSATRDNRLEGVVLRALERDPNHRFQHASEIRENVRQLLAPKRTRGRVWAFGGLAVGASAAAAALMLKTTDSHSVEPDPFPPVWENSLGMRFRPVPDVPGLVSIWETRVRDWNAFASEQAPGLTAPPFKQSDDHPLTGVSLDTAEAFCRWLTAKERRMGLLTANQQYRLPSDEEWSLAVGLREPAAASPAQRHLQVRDEYPWGTLAPIPLGAGNYPDSALQARVPTSQAVAGYYDGIPFTSPVGTFAANPLGLHDLGGNVWELTSSPFSPEMAKPTWRGGSWAFPDTASGFDFLLSSFRLTEGIDLPPSTCGFRIVRAQVDSLPAALLSAVQDGDAAAVRDSLTVGNSKLDETDAFGRTALALAVRSANQSMVNMLLEAGARVDLQDPSGFTPMHDAAKAGHAALIKRLVAHGGRVDVRAGGNGLRPLDTAAAAGSIPVMEALLEAGARVNPPGDTDPSPVVEALSQRHASAALWLLDHGADPQADPQRTGQTPVAVAALYGEAEVVARLLSMGAAIETRAMGLSLLSLAAMGADPETIQLLIDRGVDTSEITPLALACASQALIGGGAEPASQASGAPEAERPWGGVPPMLRAVMKRFLNDVATRRASGGRAESIRKLVEAGAPIEERLPNGLTVFQSAVYVGDGEAVQALLAAGCDPQSADHAGFTPLHTALERGHLEIVRLLLGRQVAVGTLTAEGLTPLHIASVAGRAEAVPWLVAAGAEVNAPSRHGLTALQYAAGYGWGATVEALIGQGARVDAVGGATQITALHLAAGGPAGAQAQMRKDAPLLPLHEPKAPASPAAPEDQYLAAVRLLLDHGARVDVRTSEGVAPMHFAAQHDAEPIVTLLLDRGAGQETHDLEFRTPLHYAAIGNAARVTALLLSRGAKLNPLLAASSPFHEATARGNVEVAALLRGHGADLDGRNAQTATPLHLAIDGGHRRMVEWLVEAGADLEQRDGGWMTPLHRAVHAGSPEIVRLLCQRGANPDARDFSSATPLQYAQSLNQPELQAILRQAAASRRPTATRRTP
ncbi:MAG: ankyrin repeat domain-containing protein [Verrucomicrobiales bacterium]